MPERGSFIYGRNSLFSSGISQRALQSHFSKDRQQPCRLLHLSGWGKWSALQASYEHSSWNYFRNRKWQRSKGTSCHFMARTDVEIALSAVIDAEKQYERAKLEFSSAKKRLARAFRD
jgi:hypothetical protein